MLVLRPDYYDKFKCIGDKCPNTCCAGWNVTIDEDTYDKYKKLNSDYGKNIMDSITKTDKWGYIFKMGQDLRCPHLSEKGLCNIYSNISEDYMCNTCKVYPRRFYVYNNEKYEADMVASCPEIARELVERKNKIEFKLDELDMKISYGARKFDGDYDEDYYNLIFEVRSNIIDIIQLEDFNLYEKCMIISAFSDNIQKMILEYNNWENKLLAVKEAILSEEFMDIIKNNRQYQLIDKVKFLRDLLKNEVALEKYELITPVSQYVNNIKNMTEQDIYDSEQEFSNYFNKEYPNVYANYMVYLSFDHINKTLIHNNIDIEIKFVFMSTVIIQTLLYNSWIQNDKKLAKEDIEKVIYTYTKFTEHNSEKLYNLLNKIMQQNITVYELAKMII